MQEDIFILWSCILLETIRGRHTGKSSMHVHMYSTFDLHLFVCFDLTFIMCEFDFILQHYRSEI